MQPSVSVIIFLRNAASTIESTLLSVVEQQIPDLELIGPGVVSTVGTVAVTVARRTTWPAGAARRTASRPLPLTRVWNGQAGT